MTDLAGLTTLRVGGPARSFAEAASAGELIELVEGAEAPVLLVGGGSNLLVADAGFDGRVVAIRHRGIESEVRGAEAVVTAQAGEPWDAFVDHTVRNGWSGLEALSGIPGLVGATPVQNVGAYGAEVAQGITGVRAWDRRERTVAELAGDDCAFAYRNSRFKADPGRWVVLAVTFRLAVSGLSAPVRYAELARFLGVAEGERAPVADVRAAVLAVRRRKGMVLDPADHDTWSAGSFFTNPIVEPDRVPAAAPHYPQPDGRVKTSAAWLIEGAGFEKGYGRGAARLSSKHVLALTNAGGARAADLLDLAREVRDGVRDRWGISLVNEPIIVGASL